MSKAPTYRELIEQLGLTQLEAAIMLEIGLRTSKRYATEGGAPGHIMALLNLMVRKGIAVEEVNRLRR